jgi:hypothetical protein
VIARTCKTYRNLAKKTYMFKKHSLFKLTVNLFGCRKCNPSGPSAPAIIFHFDCAVGAGLMKRGWNAGRHPGDICSSFGIISTFLWLENKCIIVCVYIYTQKWETTGQMYQLWDFLTIPARLEGKKALQIYREPWLLPTFSIMYYIYIHGGQPWVFRKPWGHHQLVHFIRPCSAV